MMLPGPPILTEPLESFIRRAWQDASRTKVKICGIQDLESAFVAAEAGADFLGFVFVPGARRRLDEEYVQELIARFRQVRFVPDRPTLVGLFADQPADEVNRIAQKVGVDMVQLCGKEEMHYCARMAKPVVKVFHVRQEWPREVTTTLMSTLLDRHSRAGHLCTLDRYAPEQRGGTGHAFDWSMARHLSGSYRFLLAGGLTAENVGKALQEAAPWGVDVSSGVETDGKKDPEKIRSFIRAVREADRRRRQGSGPLSRALSLLGGGPIRKVLST